MDLLFFKHCHCQGEVPAIKHLMYYYLHLEFYYLCFAECPKLQYFLIFYRIYGFAFLWVLPLPVLRHIKYYYLPLELYVLLQSVSLENLSTLCTVHKMLTCVQASVAGSRSASFWETGSASKWKAGPGFASKWAESGSASKWKGRSLRGSFYSTGGSKSGKSEYCSRIQIKLKGRIPIRINVMRIRNTGTERDTAGKYSTISKSNFSSFLRTR